MRFKKGTQVEVLRKAEVPYGSWWLAEIISGNGHTYTVKYCKFSGLGTVDRVSRTFLRPRPPPFDSTGNWVVGDIVEVFDGCCWRTAKLLSVSDKGCFFVRFLGSYEEYPAHKSNIRVRLSWLKNTWVVIGKEPKYCGDANFNRSPILRPFKVPGSEPLLQDMNIWLSAPVKKGVPLQRELHSPHVRNHKRVSSTIDSCDGPNQKVRATERNVRVKGLASQHCRPLVDKVDAVVSPIKALGANCMHASLDNRESGLHEMDVEESRISSAQLNCDTNSVTCSVASCSSTPDLHKFPSLSRVGSGLDSYAESSSSDWRLKGISFSEEEEISAEIHKLELRAYQSTMEALYVSGPLSWEQEEMMTNLRLTLNITNDEHLLQLRHLVSVQN